MQDNQAQTHKKKAAAVNPALLVKDMLGSVERLRSVYERETEALTQHDAKSFMALQNEKVEAARDYQNKAQQILSHKNEMKDADPSLKEKLEATQKDFAVLMDKNRSALERMHRTGERLGNTIRSAARDAMQREHAFSYGQSGTMQMSNSKVLSTGVIETA